MDTTAIDHNSLVEQMLPYERILFLWLNNSHNTFWDNFMWIYSGKLLWIPLAITALLVFTYRKPWKQAVLFVLCFVFLAFLCDQISASIIKPMFERLRPTHHPDFEHFVLTVNGYKGGRYGFISAHAANGFGVATFLSLVFKYRKFTIVIYSWALLTAYSRIYLGVHFITDVLGGMIVGISIGILIYLLFQLARKFILKQTATVLKQPAYKHITANVLITMIFILVLTDVVISIMDSMKIL